MVRRMIPCMWLKNGRAVRILEGNTAENDREPLLLTESFCAKGADELVLFDLSSSDEEHEKAIGLIRQICEKSLVPVRAGGHINRLEDVKKLLYAGCAGVIMDYPADEKALSLLREASARFGKEKITLLMSENASLFCEDMPEGPAEFCSELMLPEGCAQPENCDFPVVFVTKRPEEAKMLAALKETAAAGICSLDGFDGDFDWSAFKTLCRDNGIEVLLYESPVPWSDFKTGPDGLVPVIVQDYKTGEVLMLAYMNEEAFTRTIRSGRMTYWSRSRQEIWVKGLTSGHFQYVKSMAIDCDNDTLLAKVEQIGAACHTGNRSCFYRTLLEKEYDHTNPMHVFSDVYKVIEDRKASPREGSYTNYLFDKGIDKILKKVGEECTEIVIAAKNPDPEEIKYEISDFLYHVMVLMVEKGITWEDVTTELSRR